MSLYRRGGKRALDIIGSLCLLAGVAPILLIAAIAIRLRIGAPVLWRQERPGLGGRPFTLIKLRTMANRCGPSGALLPDAERLTPIGSFLRSCSIDELPELLNVLKGDISLVGPRPLLVQYLARYTAGQARRHEVRPGITGWAQVNGRNDLSWEEKFSLDVWYVDNYSLTLDLTILVLTVWQVIARRGINEPGHATAREFTGAAR